MKIDPGYFDTVSGAVLTRIAKAYDGLDLHAEEISSLLQRGLIRRRALDGYELRPEVASAFEDWKAVRGTRP